MPSRPKSTREEIVATAFEIIKQDVIDAEKQAVTVIRNVQTK